MSDPTQPDSTSASGSATVTPVDTTNDTTFEIWAYHLKHKALANAVRVSVGIKPQDIKKPASAAALNAALAKLTGSKK